MCTFSARSGATSTVLKAHHPPSMAHRQRWQSAPPRTSPGAMCLATPADLAAWLAAMMSWCCCTAMALPCTVWAEQTRLAAPLETQAVDTAGAPGKQRS